MEVKKIRFQVEGTMYVADDEDLAHVESMIQEYGLIAFREVGMMCQLTYTGVGDATPIS
jgi:hypothetical protein